MVGVAALIIVLSLMNGFAGEIRSRLIGVDAHLRVLDSQGEIEDFEKVADRIRNLKHVLGIAPFIYREAMVVSKAAPAGVRIKAIDQEAVKKVSNLAQNIIYGRFNLKGSRNLPGIALGRYLAERLGLVLGDEVYVLSPQGLSITSLSGMPRLNRFIVTGVFETGMYDYDASLVLISIEQAQKIFDLGRKVSGLELKIDDMNKAEVVGNEITKILGYKFYTFTWMDLNKNLFSWMTIEKWAAFVILCLIVLVAAFNIISTLIMVVMEKTKEIGILKSMGATSKSLKKIFVFEGVFVAVVGVSLGCIVGFALCWIQKTFKIISLPSDIYIISSLPVDMRPFDFLWISIAALVICYLSALYPARRAALLDPVEAIRYE